MVKLPIALLTMMLLCSCSAKTAEHTEDVSKAANIEIPIFDYKVVLEQMEQYKSKNTTDNEIKDTKEIINKEKPEIDEAIPLSDDVLDYMYEISDKYNVAYSLVLAMADVESSFRPGVVSPANCIGLMQLSPSTAEWIASELGVEKYNLKNARDSILFGVFYIDYLHDQWLNKGYSEEDAYFLTVTSYNRGIAKTNSWIKQHGFNNGYFDKVNKKKQYYEELMNESNND